MASSARRILVHFQKIGDKTPVAGLFAQSVIDTLYPGNGDIINVTTKLEDDKLVVTLPERNGKAVRLKRPSFCPFHCMPLADREGLPADIQQRGIDVGTVVILESCDGKILLTRRAKHLRAFPGVWVPPGGHIESGESIEEAGLRELKEETGIDLQPDTQTFEKIAVLALWESAFPYMLSVGLPKRHHIVVYIHAKLKPPNTAEGINKQLKLDRNEVEASAWLSRDVIEAIVSVSEELQEDIGLVQDIPQSIRITEINSEDKMTECALLTKVLLQRAPLEGTDVERVSTGTKFALSEWLTLTQTR